ncbi:MAG: hypothetical protein GY847_17490 [Proteobacteria bacterium]|nr:hypothetical protein [Pseudomonadota bacterium]
MKNSLPQGFEDDTGLSRSDEDELVEITPRKMSPLKKFMLWLGVIAVLCLAIVAAGVHLGAHGEGKWYTNAVMWIVENTQQQ